MIIVGLVVLIVICGALAFFVTSSGISFNNDPVPVMNNTTTNIIQLIIHQMTLLFAIPVLQVQKVVVQAV